jgi:hypothetical protein
MNQNRTIGITVVAVFAMIAGLGEIVAGFTGNYLRILTPVRMSRNRGVRVKKLGAFQGSGGDLWVDVDMGAVQVRLAGF